MMGSGKAVSGGCGDSAAVGRNDKQAVSESKMQKYAKTMRTVLGQVKRSAKKKPVL